MLNSNQPVPELERCVLFLEFLFLSYGASVQYPSSFLSLVFLNLGMYFAQKI